MHLLPWFKEVQGRRDARKRELADEQRGVQPRVPFFLHDKSPAFSIQLRKDFQFWHHIYEDRKEEGG